jgi:outer membrane protein assembly complex protein YaeT
MLGFRRSVLGAAVALWAAGLLGGADFPEGKPVGSVRFEPPDQPFSAGELRVLAPIVPGEPLREAAVREAIRRLFATGRYQDIVIDYREEGGALAVIIRTEAAFFVGPVAVNGVPEPPTPGNLASATKLNLGQLFMPSDVDAAIENLNASLRGAGFLRAAVVSSVRLFPERSEAAVRFDVQPGRRARFGGLHLEGTSPRSRNALLRSSGWLRGAGPLSLPGLGFREYTQQRLQEGLEKMRLSLQKGDRLLARVTLERLDFDAARNRLTPAVRIDPGPVVRVRTTGGRVSGGRLKQLLPIYQERSVDATLLNEGRRNLAEYFRSQGYFGSTVDFTRRDEPDGAQLIEFIIDRGERSRLTALSLRGNRFFDAQTIRERIAILPATWLRYRNGRFSERLLEQDLEAIRDLYRANGFREAEVTARRETNLRGKPENLGITIEIEEGPQWRVAAFRLEGVPSEVEAAIGGQLRCQTGQSYSEANVIADRDFVISYFYDLGYPDVVFDWSAREDATRREVDLTYSVTPGERQYVRSVLLSGLAATNRDFVRDRIRVQPGDPLSLTALTAGQRRLYDLGIFARVQTALQNPLGREDRRNVLFDFEEAKKYSFNFGFGAELGRFGGGVVRFASPAGATTFSPRVNAGISRLNVFGVGHTVSLLGRVSNVQQRAVLSYLAPQFRGAENVNFIVSGLYDRSLDVRTFAAQRLESSVQLGQRWSRAVNLQYRVTFRRVRITDVKISPGLIPLLSQPTQTGLLGFSFIRDRRDDPANSRRGTYTTLDASSALGFLASRNEFLRVLLRNTSYHRLGRDVILARTSQFGHLQRTGGPRELALPERFFSGGASVHRAFPENQAGPRDTTTGFPLGGQALVMNSVEVRYPVLGDNLGGVVFWDAGNVFARLQDVSLRFRQRDLTDFNYLVHGIGLGVRYKTPIGPLRFDISYSPNSPRFFGFRGTFDDLIAGRGQRVNQRVNVFQFHFALGQTY